MPEVKTVWEYVFEVLVCGIYCRQPGTYATYLEAQDAAIANSKRPYRILKLPKP